MTAIENLGASKDAIQYHYDVGNDFYAAWLGPSMCYSAAMWGDGIAAGDLDAAQLNKLDWHIAAAAADRGERVLDIGCGWGSLLFRLVERHGVSEAVGLTLSEAQAAWIRARAPANVRVLVAPWQDYRDETPFDSIISIGAFEHFAAPELDEAGKVRAYRAFFEHGAGLLGRAGRLSLQTIAWQEVPKSRQLEYLPTAIFPESNLPYLSEIVLAAETSFDVLSLSAGGSDYARTLRHWIKGIKARRQELAAAHGEEVVQRYLENFTAFAFGFERRLITLYRLVLRKRRLPEATRA